MKTKVSIFCTLCVIYMVFVAFFMNSPTSLEMETALAQMNHGSALQESVFQLTMKNYVHLLGPTLLIFLGVAMFAQPTIESVKKFGKKFLMVGALLSCFTMMGCWRGYEPQKLEVINTYEEGFLLPFTTDSEKQTSSNNEEYLQKNLVYTQQVRIPQRWLQTGYGDWNGSWVDAALLIKVDKSPVTREWTADSATGTSNTNQAVWVMTADGVEFSTGWTCTARILSKEDAVKFLHNYRNETLAHVLDTEVRARIQTEFGMEVTDLHMQELRVNATPHISKVIESVEKFFLTRGITITNLGITGGFVYKDKSIMDMLVKVFNAEQQKNIAVAETSAQSEKNKKIQLEAEAKAKAIVAEKDGEAKGIRAVAEAKLFEVEKAKENLEFYILLKRIEVQKSQIEKWDGQFPKYMMGGSPNLLMTIPEDVKDKKEKEHN